MEEYRIERDGIGEVEVPAEALYGIHALRAHQNFPGAQAFPIAWYQAMGMVKLAYYQSITAFKSALAKEYSHKEWAFRIPSTAVISALTEAAQEMIQGAHFIAFIVPAVQGGAGTSINMNVNEILANRALTIMGHPVGNYEYCDPIIDANAFQSTNDTVPTALRLAAMQALDRLEAKVNQLRKAFENKENTYRQLVRIGYTQYQEAVPSSYGKLFGGYCEALSRDWWRISKGKERIKVVNLGGSAIGTGLTVPRFVIMDVVERLRGISNYPLAKAENLPDATANQDDLVELHGLLKTLAINLNKIAGDLRLLASDVSAVKGFQLPARQAGSSIMPGKVNPVIPEFVISSAQQVLANDVLINNLAAQGSLELNPYVPQIGVSLLGSIELLVNATQSLAENCVDGLTISAEKTYDQLIHSSVLTTALVPYIGYHKAADLARKMKEDQYSIFEANAILKYIDPSRLAELMQPEQLLQLGFSVKDL